MAMKLAEIKELTVDEINEQLDKSRLELVQFKMKLSSRQLDDPSQVKKKRKEIAKLLTIKNEKARSGEVDQPKPAKKEKAVKKEDSKEEAKAVKKPAAKKTAAKKPAAKKASSKKATTKKEKN